MKKLYWKLKWLKSLYKNGFDSYGLAVLTTALLIAEEPHKDPDELIHNNMSGLSGFQAAGAKSLGKDLIKRRIIKVNKYNNL